MSTPQGYSGTPLPKKLGIKPGSKYLLLNAPDSLKALLAHMEPGAEPAIKGPADVALLFAKTQSELQNSLELGIDSIKKDGGLWICWPKKASKVPTDITENDLRTILLPLGLVDNKVCAVDETWSGLRFVWRIENR